MSSAFFRASGIDSNEDADVVFVWCRNKGPDDYLLVGSGHIVRAKGRSLPNGISPGQYSVTFLLPFGCSAANVVVTDDKSGKETLTGVSVLPCSAIAGLQPQRGQAPEATSARSDPQDHATPTNRSGAAT